MTRFTGIDIVKWKILKCEPVPIDVRHLHSYTETNI